MHKLPIIIRLNPLYLLIIGIPLLIFIYFIINDVREYLRPIQIENESSYIICSISTCRTFPKNVIDHPEKDNEAYGEFSMIRESERQLYYRLLETKSHQRNEILKLIGLYTAISVMYSFIFLLIYTRNKIVYDGETILFRNKFFFVGREGRIYYRWKITPDAIVSVKTITKIVIKSTTQALPVKTSLSQVNWRDRILLTYHDLGIEKTAAVELALFPGFKKVLLDITNKKTDIPITFSKTTPHENYLERWGEI